jgi:hypothetical protein
VTPGVAEIYCRPHLNQTGVSLWRWLTFTSTTSRLRSFNTGDIKSIMGGCISVEEKAEKERSMAIDRQIEEDSKKLKKECKILLLGTPFLSFLSDVGDSFDQVLFSYLGSGESGKSTIVKQMRIIHQDGFKHEELVLFRQVIFRNLVESAQNVVLAMKKFGLDAVEPINRVRTHYRALDRRLTGTRPLNRNMLNTFSIFNYHPTHHSHCRKISQRQYRLYGRIL